MTSGHSNASARATSSRCGSTTGSPASSGCSSTRTSRAASACQAFEARIAEVTEAVRSAPLRAARRPGAASEPEEHCVANRARAPRASGAAAAVAVLAFLGFAAAPDRSGLAGGHALIASALDRPLSTNDLLDRRRPADARLARDGIGHGERRDRRGQAASAARRLAPPARRMRIDLGRRSLPSVGERPGRGRCGGGGSSARPASPTRLPREHREGRPRQDARRSGSS